MKPDKPPCTRIRQIISSLLLTLATLPVLASPADSATFQQPLARLAQLSPEEHRELRERWQQASPEERLRLRKFFLERMQRMPGNAAYAPIPPAVREAIPFPLPGRPARDDRDPARGNKPEKPPEAGFGFGFENRDFEQFLPDFRRPERD